MVALKVNPLRGLFSHAPAHKATGASPLATTIGLSLDCR